MRGGGRMEKREKQALERDAKLHWPGIRLLAVSAFRMETPPQFDPNADSHGEVAGRAPRAVEKKAA